MAGALPVTDSASERLMRLPLFEGLGRQQDFVMERVFANLGLRP